RLQRWNELRPCNTWEHRYVRVKGARGLGSSLLPCGDRVCESCASERALRDLLGALNGILANSNGVWICWELRTPNFRQNLRGRFRKRKRWFENFGAYIVSRKSEQIRHLRRNQRVEEGSTDRVPDEYFILSSHKLGYHNEKYITCPNAIVEWLRRALMIPGVIKTPEACGEWPALDASKRKVKGATIALPRCHETTFEEAKEIVGEEYLETFGASINCWRVLGEHIDAEWLAERLSETIEQLKARRGEAMDCYGSA
ncbi:MAG: hypothetical protein KC931_22800, partial [Candidatus Omnitrophica bacterium]|nr:hypothetical protein [Candidatus Omnitrophota bacterium]